VKGVPHSRQNLACGGLSCWHRGHRIPSVSRVRIRQRRPGTTCHGIGRPPEPAPRPSLRFGSPDPTPTRPRALDGRFWSVVHPVGRPHRQLRRARTHVYAVLLTANAVLAPCRRPRLSPHRNLLNRLGRNGWKPPRPESGLANRWPTPSYLGTRSVGAIWPGRRRCAVNVARIGVISGQRNGNSPRDLAGCSPTEAVTSGHPVTRQAGSFIARSRLSWSPCSRDRLCRLHTCSSCSA
jgi:hypothetical protein